MEGLQGTQLRRKGQSGAAQQLICLFPTIFDDRFDSAIFWTDHQKQSRMLRILFRKYGKALLR